MTAGERRVDGLTREEYLARAAELGLRPYVARTGWEYGLSPEQAEMLSLYL